MRPQQGEPGWRLSETPTGAVGYGDFMFVYEHETAHRVAARDGLRFATCVRTPARKRRRRVQPAARSSRRFWTALARRSSSGAVVSQLMQASVTLWP
jgi:hypothetical protein